MFIKNQNENSKKQKEINIYMNYDGLKMIIILLMRKGTLKINVKTYQNYTTLFKCKNDIFT